MKRSVRTITYHESTIRRIHKVKTAILADELLSDEDRIKIDPH